MRIKEGFDVEDDEKHRNQIKFRRQADMGITNGFNARFEWRVFVAGARSAAKQPSSGQHESTQAKGNNDKYDKRPVLSDDFGGS